MDDWTVWRYRGVEIELDLLDEETVRRYGECAGRLAQAERAARGEGREAFIAGFCGRLRAFFDDLFGEGTGLRLIGGRNSLRAAMACYGDFLAFGKRQGEAARAWLEESIALYAPERTMRDGMPDEAIGPCQEHGQAVGATEAGGVFKA